MTDDGRAEVHGADDLRPEPPDQVLAGRCPARRVLGEPGGDHRRPQRQIGGGTGLNLTCYGPAVGSLTITEPQPPMLRRLERRVRAAGAGQHGAAATVLRAPAEDLPFDDQTFDMAVSTLVLCGVDDQPRALRELRRVLRPGGELLFIEHVRAGDPATARRQGRVNWLNRLVAGCDCNRPTLESIGSAGFTVTEVEHTELPKAPKFIRPAVAGRAQVGSAGSDHPV
jgi:SAM-dependent methyltransferase